MQAFMGILYAGMGAGMASTLTGDLSKAKVAAHDLFELLDRESLINGLDNTGVAAVRDVGRIELQSVDFSYPLRPELKVLRSLSFSIEAGTSVGVVGPSGGGKSTVLSMLQRFYDPQGGKVLVGSDQVPLGELSIRWWRRQVGFVGQEPILFDATVLENVRYGLEDGEDVSRERLEECKQMCNLTFLDSHTAKGWNTPVGPRGQRLSGGQKQRVAICRAMVKDPPILLLDEATSALDSQSERVVSAALERAQQGRTSFSIAHRLSTIQHCDVILVVAEGRIVERGRHDELMELGGVYKKLYQQSRKQ
jgi:ABC-type multidrug transport system fused ATPase/permease subunit